MKGLQNFVQMLRVCLLITAFLIVNVQGSALHGECVKNEHCGTVDTYCRNGTCVCRENFTVFFDSCIEILTPRIICKHKLDCSTILGSRSICNKEAYCACKSFHHIYFNGTKAQCVKNRGLDEICDLDYQCYCGQECEGKIGCINKFCNCKPGFKQQNRRCISLTSSASINLISLFLIVVSPLLIYLK